VSDPGGVEIFAADLDAPPLPHALLEQTLSPDERARVARMHNPLDRTRRQAAWGLVRTLLAHRIGADPAGVRIETAPEGKPHLPGGPAFNLSHSGPHLLVGLMPEGCLGVDIEVARPMRDLEAVARRYFAPAEVEELLALPSREREAAFFRGWVRKEAFLKATGRGLRAGLSSFTVALGETRGNALLTPPEGADPRAWTVRSLEAPPGAAAAVAWDRPGLAITRGAWPTP